jgi:hypothetical protein
LKQRLAKQKKQARIVSLELRTMSMGKNVFEDLGFSREEAAALKLKADLHSKIVKRAARYSQAQLQQILD